MKESERTGSTRIMRPVEPGIISLEYTDRWSAFDRGSSDQVIPGLGAARCACAVTSFGLARARGLPTHFIEQVGPQTIHVLEFSVPGRDSLSGEVRGRVLPLEWIWRTNVFGSMLERIKDGRVDPVTLGFAPGTVVIEGMQLPKMVIECTTKFEPVDRHLSNEEALTLAGISREQQWAAQGVIAEAVYTTNAAYDAVGFMSPDGKLELGMLDDGTLLLVDVFGTQDENRLIDKATGDVYSKDLIRNWLNAQTFWKAALTGFKAEYPTDKSKWPPYPELPVTLVDLVSERYAEVARRYAGVNVVY
jgi:phosphoribosylaminoimidazole-succinocarboxamide synthase